jgi:glycosyltransferase involved in cell wall biosynthesis
MNICLVSREYPTQDHTGGIATYTEKTARALSRLGHDVTVITERGGQGSAPERGPAEDGVRVMQLSPPRSGPSLPWRAYSVARAISTLPHVPTIVQACEYRAEGFLYAMSRRSGTRLVTRLATPTFLVDQLNQHEQDAGPRTRIVDRLERLQTRRSDGIISPTNALADIVCRQWGIPRHHVATIRTGVEFAQRYGSNPANLPVELSEKQYMIYFGRLEERKGVHILAQALPELLSRYSHLHAVFVGNVQSYQGESLRTFIERHNEAHRDRLHFFPRLSQRELYPILAQAQFAVLPSLWENLANTCLEALDMGKPVVATLGCGFGEVIEEGRSGMLVPPGSVPALRDAMLDMLADEDRLIRMSAGAKAAAQAFSQDAVAEDLVRFYLSLRAAGDDGRPAAAQALPGRS